MYTLHQKKQKTNIMNTDTFPFLSTQSLQDVVIVFNKIIPEVAKRTSIIFKVTDAKKLQVSSASDTYRFNVYVDLIEDESDTLIDGIKNVVVDGITKSSVSEYDGGIRYTMNYIEFVGKLNSLNRTRKVTSLTASEAVESTQLIVDDTTVIEATEVPVEAAQVENGDTVLINIYKRIRDVKNCSVYHVAFIQDMRKKKDNIQIIFNIDKPFTLSKDSKVKFIDDWSSFKKAEHVNMMDIFYQGMCNITRTGKLHTKVLQVKNLIKKIKPDIERQMKIENLLA
jgi:hypothetical protein